LAKEVKACLDGDIRAANILSLERIGQTAAEEATKFNQDDSFNMTFKGVDRGHLRTFMKQVEQQEMEFIGSRSFREDDGLHLNPDMRLYGGKQYQRMKFYFWRALDQAVDIGITEDEMLGVLGFLGNDHTSQDIDAAAVRLIKFCMERSVLPGITYLLRRTGFILFRLVNIAIWTLAIDADWKAVTDRFVSGVLYERLISASMGFLKTSIQHANEHCKEDAEASYGTIGNDLKNFPLVQELMSSSQSSRSKSEKKDSNSSEGVAILDDKRDPRRELEKVVRSQVSALMCLNKINLNNSINSLVFLKFRDSLQETLLAVINKMTDPEIVELFGAGGSQIEKELHELEKKKDAVDDIISKYIKFQDFVNAL